MGRPARGMRVGVILLNNPSSRSEAQLATLQIYNPTAAGPEQQEFNSELQNLHESRVGVLANSKQHADLILGAIADRLSVDYGVIKTVVAKKVTNGPTPPEVEDEFVEGCDWVLLGSAD